MENVFTSAGLTKVFSKKAAVSNVSMNINKGDIYGFIGKNGAGKTTLMKMLVGLIAPTSGSIKLFSNDNLNAERKKIGAVIETPSFMPNLSAKENLKVQWMLVGNKDKSIIDETLKLVGLDDVGKKKAKKFSLGMKQRLGIAMALIGEPEFLVLDEPTNGLDPEGIIEIRTLIKKLNKERGITVLISSHILGELSKLATRYGIINDGKLIEEFTEQELRERCRANLTIKVDDVQKAASIIENTVGTKNYKVLNENSIELYDKIDNPGIINSALAKNDIVVNSISYKEADLEEYFMRVIGGKKND